MKIVEKRLKRTLSDGSKETYVYISYCEPRSNGQKHTKNVFVSKLGKLSDLKNKYPTDEEYQTFIDEKIEKVKKELNIEEKEKICLSFDPERDLEVGEIEKFSYGEIFAKRIMDDINFKSCLDKIQKETKITFSLYDLLIFLLGQRMINPDSKLGMYQKAKKRSIITPDFALHQVYRGMDTLLEHKSDILKWLYQNRPSDVNRDYSLLYFDCTNTYMETDVEEGLKARGHGKRNELDPLISFGLLLDGSGMPLSFTIYKGNESETKYLIPLEEEIMNDFKNTDFIIITDAGLSSKEIRAFNQIANRDFITVVPVRKMGEDKLNKYIFDEINPWKTTNDKYKTPNDIWNRYYQISEMLENGKISEKDYYAEVEMLKNIILSRRYAVKDDVKPVKFRNRKSASDKYIEEDYLVTFSLKYAIKERHSRENMIKKAKKWIEEGKVPNKKSSKNLPTDYINTISTTKEGEIAQEKTYELDQELIKKRERLDGYYCISTSLDNTSSEKVLRYMKYRWFIEDSFKVMKQYLNFRPINHSKDKRIECHFFTVFLTLVIYRYMQIVIEQSNIFLSNYYTDEVLFDVLRNMEIIKKNNHYFPATEVTAEMLKLCELFNINFNKEIMKPSYIKSEINKKRKIRQENSSVYSKLKRNKYN
ncbi:MAG: IS1634 family transposase [Firmicutes bacterium]|nr:IS1634 family transposase [Candidatus Alectryobacillus merdavium]